MPATAITTERLTTRTTLQRMVVLIPTCSRSSLLGRTLDSLLLCYPPEGTSVEVVVIENGKKQDVQTLINNLESPFPLTYRYHPEGNKSSALNSVLLDYAEAFLLFLDDDVRVAPQLLQIYSSAAHDRTNGFFFGGGVLVDYEDIPPEWLLRYLPPSAKGWRPAEYYVEEGMGFLGCNWAAFARDIIQCGAFNPSHGPGSKSGATGQESNMQNRLRRAGVKPLYLYDAIVWHYVPKSHCSPSWALRRAQYMSSASALNLPDEELDRSFLGFPLWLYKETARSIIKMIETSIGSAEEKFAGRFRFNQHIGTFRGLRERRRLRADN